MSMEIVALIGISDICQLIFLLLAAI